MGSSPYAGLPAESFWRLGVAEQTPGALASLYRCRFQLTSEMRIAIAGDCFAQEFACRLRAHAAAVLDCEPAPPRLPQELAQRYGYSLFSARYGEIYFARQLRQLIDEAYGRQIPQDAVWERDGRYYDALRPSVEPNGLGSPAEVVAHRRRHLLAVRKMLESTDVFVYAFSLNEAWMHTGSGTVYPTAPSTVAGSHDPATYHWHAFDYGEAYDDFKAVAAMLREINPRMRLLIIVSPVPGTATVTDTHVLTANTRHKAILRAVAGTICDELDFVDYFPAYELVATHFTSGQFYKSNRRTVSADGFAAIMRMFLDGHPALAEAPAEPHSAALAPAREQAGLGDDEDACQDALLDAFAP